MHILMATPEASPFARADNLAEVIYGLARALVRLGNRVTIVMPFYRQAKRSKWPSSFTGQTVFVPLAHETREAEIFHTALEAGLDFYFVRQDSFFDRDGLYGTCYGDFLDNAERFVFFSRAIMEMVENMDVKFDICHCHDWQTGLVPVYGRTLYRERARWKQLPIVYSVHNAAYQGIFPVYNFPLTGLNWELFSPKALEFYGKINFMKGGLVFADLLSTVSTRYREELQTPESGFGLEGVFEERAAELFGIPEGVDYSCWNTLNNAFLAAPYSMNDLTGKKTCKAHLMTRFGLDLSMECSLIGMNSPCVEHKGIDLVENILEDLMHLEAGLVLQGYGEKRHHHLLMEIQARHPKQIGLFIGYSYRLVHKIIAGSDIFLMPFRYEPGGLDQLLCLRYGTVPVVRATGGLDESIREYHPKTRQGNGFKFSGYASEELMGALLRAITLFKDESSWEALIRNNMALDYSWDSVVPQYLELYRRAQEKRRLQL